MNRDDMFKVQNENIFIQELTKRPRNQIKSAHFPLQKQAQPIDPDLTAKLLGRGVAVSPVVTVEPRRRKFHKAITLSMPAPRAHSQGMINQYSGNAPTLRLLCSITGMCYVTLKLSKFS
jgi:hypothetical protein